MDYTNFYKYTKSGVSNTRPARYVCAARDIIKTIQIIDKTTFL